MQTKGTDMAKERGTNVVARNRKARHDYHIEDTIEAGLVLWGTEVKSLRAGRASLVDGFATIERGEAWLEGVHTSRSSRWIVPSSGGRSRAIIDSSVDLPAPFGPTKHVSPPAGIETLTESTTRPRP